MSNILANTSLSSSTSCVQYVRNLCASSGKVGNLSTRARTYRSSAVYKRLVIHENVNTFTTPFSTTKKRLLYLYATGLSPLSTPPIKNTTVKKNLKYIIRKSEETT